MVKRALVFVHRWLGVALCLLFLVWFLSGIGMMYFPMPEVTDADRLDRAPPLDASAIRMSPSEAAAALAVDVTQLRLTNFAGRPAYRTAATRAARGRVLYADTGEPQGPISRTMADAIAARWIGQPASAARVEEVLEPDQWTLQVPLAALGPVMKYAWPNGEQVYVSQASGDVVQYTTASSRLGAYLGPIPHWFYVTPLRSRSPLWNRVVVWTSGLGTIAAALGVLVGVWMYSPSKAYRHRGLPTSIPYVGQKRWHIILGLAIGVPAITYAFSGMLSMEPFPSWEDRRPSTDALERALAGRVESAAFDHRPPAEALAQLGDRRARQLEFLFFRGHAFHLARVEGGNTWLVPAKGNPVDTFDPSEIARAVTASTNGQLAARVLNQYDRYYLDRHGRLPLPVVLAEAADGSGLRYYIDPATARIVRIFDPANWKTRWLYHGLHSLDLPWLYAYRPLWDLIVLALMLGGGALSVTSIVLATRVVRRRQS